MRPWLPSRHGPSGGGGGRAAVNWEPWRALRRVQCTRGCHWSLVDTHKAPIEAQTRALRRAAAARKLCALPLLLVNSRKMPSVLAGAKVAATASD